MWKGYNVAFVLHVAIELPAALSFMVNPSRQLGRCTPHAHAVVRQYALLLFSSILVALVFIPHPADCVSGRVAASLAIYHVGPTVRSWYRVCGTGSLPHAISWGEGLLYFIVHAVCGTALFLYWLGF